MINGEGEDTCISRENWGTMWKKKWVQNPRQRDRCAQTEFVWMKQADTYTHKCMCVHAYMWQVTWDAKKNRIEYDLDVEFETDCI